MVKKNQSANVTQNGQEKSSGKKAGKRIGGRAGFVVGSLATYLLAVGIITSAINLPAAVKNASEANDIKNAKVVLYEGPKSLKDATADDLATVSEAERDMSLMHCVDTSVTVNGKDCYVYDTNVNNSHTWVGSYMPPQSRTPITYFDFDGTVEITVKVPDKDIECATVRPLKYGIKPEINKKNHTVTFRVSNPDAYTVEFNNSVSRAVHIFANEIETDIPDKDDKDVYYIGPGEWNIENIVLEDGQTLYISGGAVIHGIVNANFAKNVKVCGRGIIDNSNIEGWKGRSASVPLKFDNCQDFTIEGITVLNCNAWCMQAYDTIGGEIDGLKMITSRPNGDGISLQSCKSINVENSFVRSWDDSLVVKNYDENSNHIKFKNVQVWTDLAQSMEIGYETNKGNKQNSTISDIYFEDITVLHNFHKSVLSIHNADDAAISDVSYKNIVVEDATPGRGDGSATLIDMQIVKNGNWSTTDNRGTISNVSIDGFKVLYGDDGLQFNFKGYDSEHKIDGVTISGLNVKGKDLKSTDAEGFAVDANTTANIEVK